MSTADYERQAEVYQVIADTYRSLAEQSKRTDAHEALIRRTAAQQGMSQEQIDAALKV